MMSGPHDHGTFLSVPFPNPRRWDASLARDSSGDRRLGEYLAVVTLSLAGDLAQGVRRTRRLLAALTVARRQLRRREALRAQFGRVDRAALVPGNRVREADAERRSVCLLGGPSPLVGPPNATRSSVD